jgi:hypothetical protein
MLGGLLYLHVPDHAILSCLFIFLFYWVGRFDECHLTINHTVQCSFLQSWSCHESGCYFAQNDGTNIESVAFTLSEIL